MRSLTVLRAARGGLLFAVALALGVIAEQGWVTNRAGFTVDVWDTTQAPGLPPAAMGSAVVGTGPIDIASDQADATGPSRIFVANSGSNTVSVIDGFRIATFATISSDGFFGSLVTPSGVTRMASGSLGPTMVVVDQAVTSGFGPTGRGTVRFIDPTTNMVVDAFRETSGSARYNGVVFSASGSSQRLWIADDGDQGVVVIKFDSVPSGPPFLLGNTILYGSSGFADFIFDTSATPSFLKAPRRLSTDGATRVVVADGGSNKVTILDANYVPTGTLGEPGAVLQNVTLATAPAGATCIDVKVVGNSAYVTTNNTAGAGPNLFRINLSTFAVTSLTLGAGTATVGGVGHTTDGNTLYVGDGSTMATIYQVDLTGGAFTLTGSFTSLGGTMPWGIYSSPKNTNPPSGVVLPPGTTPRSVDHAKCGLLGLETLLALVAMCFAGRRLDAARSRA